MKILIVEDDQAVASSLSLLLTSQNYIVEIAPDGETAWQLVEVYEYDLLMLDVLLPRLDGISLCRRLRSRGYKMPILLLTGCDTSQDKAAGLDAGADDYLVKPFNPEELLARIRALLRRGNVASPVLTWGDLRFSPATGEVGYAGRALLLTPKEYALLELFLRNPQRVFSYNVILDHLWTAGEAPSDDAIRAHIRGLRQKLKNAGAANDFIETVYGIGYRLNPLKNQPAFQALEGELSSSPGTPQQMLASLTQVWNRFRGKVEEQLALLDRATKAIANQSLDETLQQQAVGEAHTLFGALGTFGFSEGSRLAQQIEQMLQVGASLQQNEIACLCQLVAALRQEINTPREESDSEDSGLEREENCPLLLIVDRDPIAAEQVVHEAGNWGFRGAIASNLTVAQTLVEQDAPAVIVLDPTVSQSIQESLAWLAELSRQSPSIPVLVWTAHHQLTDRLDAARLGAKAFLHKPTTPAQVLETAIEVQRIDAFQRATLPGSARITVLAVDDDPQILVALQTFLEPWGFRVLTLSEPERFWQTLEAAHPDLLILDVRMPNISGIDLCRTVRNDPDWSGLPVIFLTAHTDTTTVNQVLAVGADDFVSKPIEGAELVTRIIKRLERIKLLQSRAEIDPLTWVANRPQSIRAIQGFLRLANQNQQPLCFAILDLDRFKQVNDVYSQMAGDAVLRQLGQMLRQTFHQRSIIARWGSGEFVIALYGVTKAQGSEQLSDVLKTLRQHLFTSSNGSPFRMTFSAGVAQYPDDGDNLDALNRAAQTALHQSRLAGCDCIFSAGTPGTIHST